MQANSSLKFSIARQLLQHKERYNKSIRPFLSSLPLHTHRALRWIPPAVMDVACEKESSRFLTLEEAVRNPKGNFLVGLEALNTLKLLENRLAQTEHKSLIDVPYKFEVGDLVKHNQLGHLGVVAARLPMCLETDEWVLDNLGKLDDPRMQHPWYLILVAHHQGLPLDFMRYGSQLTHEKLDPPRSIGYHRALSVYFKGYDKENGRYIPRRRGTPLEGQAGARVTPLAVEGEIGSTAVPPSPKPAVESVYA